MGMHTNNYYVYLNILMIFNMFMYKISTISAMKYFNHITSGKTLVKKKF